MSSGTSREGAGVSAAIARFRDAIARVTNVIISPSRRGFAFWFVTVLLGLLLPAPVAVPVVVARLRRAPRPQDLRGTSNREGSNVVRLGDQQTYTSP